MEAGQQYIHPFILNQTENGGIGVNTDLKYNQFINSGFQYNDLNALRQADYDQQLGNDYQQEQVVLEPTIDPMQINGPIYNNGVHMDDEIQYGHFAVTTARYNDPWAFQQISNYAQFLPQQNSSFKNNFEFSHFQNLGNNQNYGPILPVNDALMHPPPSPNLLSYYMYDNMPHFQNRHFNNTMQMTGFWVTNPNELNNQQNVMYNNDGQFIRQSNNIAEMQQHMAQPFNINRNQNINQSNWVPNQTPIPLNSSFINGQQANYKYNYHQNDIQLGNGFQHLNGMDTRSGYPILYERHNILPISNSFSHFDVPSSAIYSSSSVIMQPILPTSIPAQHRLVPGTQIRIEDARSTQWRDEIMKMAHNLYLSNPQSHVLIPMLLVLNRIHPDYLSLLLLIACVYYAQGDSDMSLKYHHAILKIDPNYVEAMNNIGTTFRNLGDEAQAEFWWRKAINAKPFYWDATENLLNILTVNRSSNRAANGVQNATSQQPRYADAYNVCCFVEKSVLGSDSFTDFCKSGTQRLAYGDISRFQQLIYSKANICSTTGKLAEARIEYEKVVQLLCGGTTVMELIHKILKYFFPKSMVPSAEDLSNFKFSNAGNLLIQPGACSQLSNLLFADSGGIPPGLINVPRTGKGSINGSSMDPYTMALHITSTTLLALAKIYQDSYVNPMPLPILLPLYYLSLALYPTPSTCNNLGIVLSNIQVPLSTSTHDGQKPFTGPNLALQYYTYGLQLDSNHPHLYTNLGSLLKDMGNVNEAINMYHRAVECNPKFDVALVNLGNAYKDSSRIQESIHWYSRAVELNPNFTEAVCGLVGSLSGICDWTHRNSQYDSNGNLMVEGWMDKIVSIVNKQLGDGSEWGRGVVLSLGSPINPHFIQELATVFNRVKPSHMSKMRSTDWWEQIISKPAVIVNEGSWAIRAVEHAAKALQQLWFKEFYSKNHWTTKINPSQLAATDLARYRRPTLPKLPVTPIPTVLPFHTFTYPLTPRQVRIISHRNALRISHTILSSSWLPKTVYPPPPPPANRLKIGYVSSDFNNHPLAHLMQSVFGFHDENLFDVYLYATSPPDKSPYRAKIQANARNFLDVTTWSVQAITEQIVSDGIHILVNLNGYTKGARNEVFAARPAPILMAYMGFAGSLGGTWCDWFIADPIVCPPRMVQADQRLLRPNDENEFGEHSRFTPLDLDPEETSEDWVYTEKLIYLPHSYFVNDHKQGFRDPDDPKYTDDNASQPHPLTLPLELLELNWVYEEARRWRMRTEIFPNLDSNAVIFANFNQLYKLDPVIFDGWLEILRRVENAVLWLLRFPAAGEPHLLNLAKLKAGEDVASRIIFTDIAPKNIHIHRGRVADIFLDTPECNAHTTAADILWSGTPIVTFPRHTHKMCSRVAASIAQSSGYGKYMVTDSQESYVERAVYLAKSLRYEHVEATANAIVLNRLNMASSPNLPPQGPTEIHRLGQGELMQLRKALFLTRDHSRLFDTPRWVRNLEKGYVEAWNRWAQDQEDQVVQLQPVDMTQQKQHTLQVPTNYLKPQFINHLNNHLVESKQLGIQEVKSACIWVQDDEDDLHYTLRMLNENIRSKVDIPPSTVQEVPHSNTANYSPSLLCQQLEDTKLVFNNLPPVIDTCPTPAS